MKKPISLLPLTLLLLLWGNNLAFGTHVSGLSITYACQNPCTTRVYLWLYRDCVVTAINNTNVTWTAAGCTPPPALGPWSTPVLTEVTALCPAIPTTCTAPTAVLPGVEEHLYWRDYDICAGSPCTYTLGWTDCCRYTAIQSLNNAGIQGLTIEGTTINTGLASCNTSPQFYNQSIYALCSGVDYELYLGGTEPDGDSLVYALSHCVSQPGTPVQYAAGYSATDPLGPTWDTQIDTATGVLRLDAVPGANVHAVVCITTTEYRNGQVIGTYARDLQVRMWSCPANTTPTLTGISNLSPGVTAVGSRLYVPMGVPVCFDLTATESDPGQTLQLYWDDNATSAVFSNLAGTVSDTLRATSPGTVQGRFCWVPQATGTYYFRFRADDGFCPTLGIRERVVIIHVGPCLTTADAQLSTCPDVDFSANTCMGGAVTYTWTGSGGLSSTAQNPTHSYAGPGTYNWQVIVGNGSQSDTVTGTVVVGGAPAYQSLLSGIHTVAPCVGLPYDTLDAGPGWAAYAWSHGATTQQTQVFLGGMYHVTVTAANGCAFTDSTQLYWAEPDIYGIVSASTGAPLQNQRILLIQHDTTAQALWAVDSTWTDSSGYYFFCNVTDTILFLKATPLLLAYPGELPTYANTTPFWNNAMAIQGLTQLPLHHDFVTLPGSNPGGPGFVGGLIVQGANKTSGIGDPVAGLTVFLRDVATGNILGYKVTDPNGHFVFGNVPLGDYEVVPDRPLVSTTNVPLVQLTAQQPVQDTLHFSLHRYWLELLAPSVGVPAPQGDWQVVAVPNPFGDRTQVWVTLPVAGDVQVRVHDVLGRTVAATTVPLAQGRSAIVLGEGLGKGVYFVRVAHGDAVRTLRVVKD